MWVLLATIFRLNVTQMRRYPVDTILVIVAMYSLFMVMFLGIRTFDVADLEGGDTLASLVVGYVLVLLVQFSYQDIAETTGAESVRGTLEQLALSPFGLAATLGARFVVTVGSRLVVLVVVLVGIMATTGMWLHVDVVSLLPLVALTMTGLLGLGFAIAGMALILKRVGGVLNFMSLFVFIPLVAMPVDDYPLLKLLPLGLGYRLIRSVMVDEAALWTVPATDVAILAGTSVAYLAAGILIFGRLDRVARDRALLATY